MQFGFVFLQMTIYFLEEIQRVLPVRKALRRQGLAAEARQVSPEDEDHDDDEADG